MGQQSTGTKGIRGRKKSSTSRGQHRFVGVRRRPSGRWVAEIKDSLQKVRLWLGTFDTVEDVARAYDDTARALRGPNARTNFEPTHSSSQPTRNSLPLHLEPFSFEEVCGKEEVEGLLGALKAKLLDANNLKPLICPQLNSTSPLPSLQQQQQQQQQQSSVVALSPNKNVSKRDQQPLISMAPMVPPQKTNPIGNSSDQFGLHYNLAPPSKNNDESYNYNQMEFIASDDQFGRTSAKIRARLHASMMWHYNTKHAAALEMPWQISSELNLHSPDQNGLLDTTTMNNVQWQILGAPNSQAIIDNEMSYASGKFDMTMDVLPYISQITGGGGIGEAVARGGGGGIWPLDQQFANAWASALVVVLMPLIIGNNYYMHHLC